MAQRKKKDAAWPRRPLPGKRTGGGFGFKGSKWSKRLKKGLIAASGTALFFTLALAVFLIYLRTQALPVTTIIQTSRLYDSSGQVIDTYYDGQNRKVVPIADIAPSLVHATLDIEDHRFYHNLGFDFRGIARAAWTDLTTMSIQEGASTITQQLARNLYLSQQRTWSRKLKEAVYTVQLEMQLSKKQILQAYLNQIYYGFSTYGVEAASEYYYGKTAEDLDLAQSSMLAGIPKGPRYFSPYLSMSNAKSRQKQVLSAMVRFGDITQTQAEHAFNEKLRLSNHTEQPRIFAPYFRDYIRKQAAQKLGITEAAFEKGGYNVFTTLNKHAQSAAEQAVHHYIPKQGGLQAALVSIDPRNGDIRAMVGGKDYENNQFNRVFSKTRQTGSSFKPIVYLTALENGFTPVTRYKSEPTVFTYDHGRQKYAPSDYADDYTNTYINMRKAIARSDNIYAVHTVMDVGPQKVIDMANKLGIHSPMKPVPSLALGVFPVSPFDMASAFGVIANEGVRAQPTAILKITSSTGKVLYLSKPPIQQAQQVVSSADTYVLTSLMESVFAPGGTGYRVAHMLHRPVAAKTGTTNTDAWMVGFTPELSTAVWVGYDKNQDIQPSESHLAAPIFASFMSHTLKQVPPKIFPIPNQVVSVYIDPKNGKLATQNCPDPQLENFVAGTQPTEISMLYEKKKSEQTGNPSDSTRGDSSSGGQRKDTSFWQDLKHWWRN